MRHRVCRVYVCCVINEIQYYIGLLLYWIFTESNIGKLYPMCRFLADNVLVSQSGNGNWSETLLCRGRNVTNNRPQFGRNLFISGNTQKLEGQRIKIYHYVLHENYYSLSAFMGGLCVLLLLTDNIIFLISNLLAHFIRYISSDTSWICWLNASITFVGELIGCILIKLRPCTLKKSNLVTDYIKYSMSYIIRLACKLYYFYMRHFFLSMPSGLGIMEKIYPYLLYLMHLNCKILHNNNY